MKKVKAIKDTNLHLLYVNWAVQHLITIQNMQKKLASYCNGNLCSLQEKIEEEVLLLINENTAYADAAEILGLIEEIE